jgi:integrase
MLSQNLEWKVSLSDDVETPTKKAVTIYSQSQLDALQRVADYDERDLIFFLLGSGCREQEAAYAMYDDVSDGVLHIRCKQEYPQYRIKDHEERLIPLADEVVRILDERRKRYPTSRLMFPTADGRPNGHLLRVIKRVGKRAGLRDEDATLHRFRRTFASRLHNAGMSLVRIMELLGHSDLKTTERYLKGISTDADRRMMNRTMSGMMTPIATTPRPTPLPEAWRDMVFLGPK